MKEMSVNRLVCVAVLTAALLVASGCRATGRIVTRTFSDDTRPIDVVVGEEFVIELPSNPSLPYRWNVEIQGPVTSLGETYVPTTPVLTGSGGKSRFFFKIVGTSPAVITFSYVSPEGKVSEEKVFHIALTAPSP
jgi:predicted secreted protein